MPDAQLILKVGGTEFRGWQKVEVRQGLSALCGAFQISLTDRWAGQPDQWQIEAGSPCEVWIDGDQLGTGYVDRARYRETARDRTIEIEAREKTQDLVDCSAVKDPGSWSGRKLEQIATELAKPFGIKVSAVASTGEAFPKFALEQGETVFSAIQRMCQARGVLPITTPTGDVQLITPGKERAGYGLTLGENLEAFEFDDDVSERFSEYIVKGYAGHKARGGGKHPRATATDAGVNRYRPLVLVHDDQATAAVVDKRARWEASVRAARARKATATLPGWREPTTGELYRFNRVAHVTALRDGVDQDLLIGSVRYFIDERKGRRTEVELMPTEAYSLEPVQAGKGKSRRGKGVAPLTGR